MARMDCEAPDGSNAAPGQVWTDPTTGIVYVGPTPLLETIPTTLFNSDGQAIFNEDGQVVTVP